MITDEQAEAAADWIRDNADRIASVRAQRQTLEEGRKSVKAAMMAKHLDLPVSAQEREAYRSKEYRDHLEGQREAVYEDERNKMLVLAAQLRIEVWRSQSANNRGRI